MTDQEMTARLIELARYYASGGLSADDPTLVAQAMEIGRSLDTRGGIGETRRIFNLIPPMQGKRTGEMAWGWNWRLEGLAVLDVERVS